MTSDAVRDELTQSLVGGVDPIRIALIAMALAFASAGTTNAAGCLKGAVVGGFAGHTRGTTL